MSSLDDLLDPLCREQFFAEYWQKKSIYLPDKSGYRNRFGKFPGIEQFPALLAGKLTADKWVGFNAKPFATFVDRSGKTRPLGFVPRDMFETLYNAGFSLCFAPVHHLDNCLSTFVDSFQTDAVLNGLTLMTCYISPPFSGSSLHFDSQDVFFCQVSGEKHWKYSNDPASSFVPINLVAESPQFESSIAALGGLGVRVCRPEESTFTEVILRPGDVLYMPAGTWHVPHTTDQPSLHYTLTFLPCNFQHLIFVLARLLAMSAPEWRRDLRFFGLSHSNDELIDFVQRRIEEFRRSVNEITPEALLAEFQRSREQIYGGELAQLFAFM